MKSVFITIGLVVAATVAALAADVVDYLRARSTGAAVIIEWRSSEESGIDRYEIERATDNGVFRYVATIETKGANHSYEYTDNEAFSKPDGNKVTATYFTYRLRVVHSDKSVEYSSSAGVSHSVSSIKRTWGMIKQMFR